MGNIYPHLKCQKILVFYCNLKIYFRLQEKISKFETYDKKEIYFFILKI